MRKLKRMLSGMLSFIFVFSVLIFDIPVKADSTNFRLEWEKESTLDASLNVVSREENYTEGLFWWDFAVNEAVSFDNGKYTLTYNIEDNKRVDVTIDLMTSYANLTYKVFDYLTGSYMDLSDSDFRVYKTATGDYVSPTSATLPPVSENYGVVYEADGKPTEMSFNIIKNTGFCFKFDNKTVKFKWVSGSGTGDLFYYVTDGLRQGNIYDIDLNLQIPNQNLITNSLQVFTGIDRNTFTSTPYANDRKGGITNPLDHTTRPFIDQNPGYEPELVLEFDMPKVWDSTTNKYVYPDFSNYTDADKTSVILDLGNDSDKRKMQIIIDNLYADDINSGVTLETASGAEVAASRNGNKVSLNITNLEAGIIYNPVQIALSKPNNLNFESIATSIEHGKVYTFPEFSIVSTAADEFYVKISPYVNYNGFYTVYKGSTAQTLTKWAEYEEKSKGSSDIYIAVDLNAINSRTQFFSIDFEFVPPNSVPGTSNVKTISQILKYTPDESDIVIGVPKNVKVLQSTIVPSRQDQDKKELLLEIQWDVAYDSILKNLVAKNGGSLDVDYSFYKGIMPYDTNEERFATVTLHMTLDGDDLKIEFSDKEGKLEESSTSLRKSMIGEVEYQTVVAKTLFRLPIAHIDEASEQFLYPNIYFITIKGEYEDLNGTVYIPPSLPVDITLDDVTKMEVSGPQNLSISDVESNSFQINWSSLKLDGETTDLFQYNKYMLEPIGLSIGEESLKYNVYITQDKSNIDDLIKYDSNREGAPETLLDIIKSYDFKNQTPDAGLSAKENLEGGTSIVDGLRKNQIIKIENILQPNLNTQAMLEFKLEDLDENQIYYVVVETIVLPYDAEKDAYETAYLDYSSYSKVVSATTLKKPEIPTDKENEPAAPKSFDYDKESTTISSADLFWDKVIETENPDSDSILEYQFVRITGHEMQKELQSSKESYDKTFESLIKNAQKTGFKTLDDNILEYNSETKGWTETNEEAYVYDPSNYSRAYLTDKNLMPNELYFYYIRTVRIVDGKDVAYSVWVPLTLTTNPVSSPTNLRVELNEDCDRESEVYVSFDIPFIDMSKLGEEYDIQYSIKKDNEEWTADRRMAPGLVKYTEYEEEGRIHCLYRIQDLEQGTMYYIRVRLFNKVLGDASLYSNTVSHRTDSDNSDKEDEIKEDWENLLKDKIKDIITKPYWIMEDHSSTTTIIYRPDAFQGVIAGTIDSTIQLAKESDGQNKTYYLPASAIEEAYNANKGFKIVYKDMDVLFSPKSIDPNLNDAILDAKYRINEGDIKDYFVKINVDFSSISYEVNGGKPISPLADISVEVVGSKQKITDWDEMMCNKLIKLAFDSSLYEDYLKDIKDNLKDGVTNEEMVKVIKDCVEDYMYEFKDEVDKQFDKVTNRNYISSNLHGNIIIAYPADASTSVSGNKRLGGVWMNMPVSSYNGKKAIYATEPAAYVFTGKTIVIPGISDLPNASVAANLIAKYGLDDYLGKDGSMNVNGALTSDMAIGCVARIAGAGRTDDPVTFLTSKGVTVSARSSQAGMPSQEVIYLTMMAYQIRTNTKVDAIQIKNYTLTSNISNISPKNKKSVQAAFELGIYANQNMNANSPMTVKEFLQMLSNLAGKINL